MSRVDEDISRAAELAESLTRNRSVILEVLLEHESYEAATDELDRSVDTLLNLSIERSHLTTGRVEQVAVFLPVNLPLYSLVLFAAVPSIMADRVLVRAPAVCPKWVEDVADVAGLHKFFPRVGLFDLNRTEFRRHFAEPSDAILFTGRYRNAEAVRAATPKSLFIYNGAGINPVVVGPGSNLTDDFDRLTTPRIFNSGQDCAGPDAYLVHNSQRDEFIEMLGSLARSLGVGSYRDERNRIGRLVHPDPLKSLGERLSQLKPYIAAGGEIDIQEQIVSPTVVVRRLQDHDQLFEFFAPVFYVLTYDSEEEIKAFCSRPEYRDYAMYASTFGQVNPRSIGPETKILHNTTVLEVEQGNTAYGGWGPRANFVARGRHMEVGPVLISEALARWGVAWKDE